MTGIAAVMSATPIDTRTSDTTYSYPSLPAVNDGAGYRNEKCTEAVLPRGKKMVGRKETWEGMRMGEIGL